MPSFDSIIVGEGWISEHYFTTDSTKESFQSEVLKLRKAWDEDAKAGHATALTRFIQARGELQVRLAELVEAPEGSSQAYVLLRTALGFVGATTEYVTRRSGTETSIDRLWASPSGEILLIEAEPADSIEDFLGHSRPLGNVSVDGKPDARSVAQLVSEIYLADQAPGFVVVMAGKWLILTEAERWAEGRYLAVDVLLVADRNDTKRGQEVDRFLAIFGRESLLPSAEGDIWWTGVLESSVKHTIGVSKDLREGIRRSIEIIANDVLTRRATQGLSLDEVDGQELAKESLRFLYRILFLLYAEASPELGVLPVGTGEYNEGYGLDRLRELTLVRINEDRSLRGTHFYQSLNRLFKLVDKGHTPGTRKPESSENQGLRFDALKADLFAESATSFINEAKLSNSALQQVLQLLLLSKEAKGKERGFISYAELGINQLGAVYEGLMSYTGFIAETDLHEVAKNGDASKGSWVVPTDRSDVIDAKHFIKTRNERTGELQTVVHPKGSFVFRLAGRERQQSASYYTPEVLTKFVVSQALEELLDQGEEKTAADDILKLTVCEPALGSGAFAIEAVRQLAAEYLKRKQEELGRKIPADDYPTELQKVKAHIALHQVHGVDLNSTAVELAEVSLWLDTMTKDLQAPWFGMRLKQGNSLVGARRSTYSVQAVKAKAYLSEEPQAHPLTGLVAALDAEMTDPAVDGRIHHFLLPGEGWGAASDAKEIKDIAAQEQKDLKAWVKSTRLALKKTQIDRLVALSERVEVLWKVALRRLQIAEKQAARFVGYWQQETPQQVATVSRGEIEAALGDPKGAYQRLKRVMNAWNALWFWPLTETTVTPPTIDEWIDGLEGILGKPIPETFVTKEKRGERKADKVAAGERAKLQVQALSAASWNDLQMFETYDYPLSGMRDAWELSEQHPWLSVCDRIAGDELPTIDGEVKKGQQRAFFHWELEFASVFGQGGFDLQVGNPPWARPRLDSEALLAESDPWWQLKDKVGQSELKRRREEALSKSHVARNYQEGVIDLHCTSAFLGSSVNFPLLRGLQPDLYRCFMSKTWNHSRETGVTGLIHPETHFTDESAGYLREATYLRLRRHWMFVNELRLFEIGNQKRYGVYIYGLPAEKVQFLHSSFNYHPSVIERSRVHDGGGNEPGIKDESSNWDLNPHAARIQSIDDEVLVGWRNLIESTTCPPRHSRMVNSVTRTVNSALVKMASLPRVAELNPEFSQGWMGGKSRNSEYFDVGWGQRKSWSEVILQGSHIGPMNSYFKSPNSTMKNQYDWTPIDLEALASDAVPATNFEFVATDQAIDLAYDHWSDGTSVRSTYRIAWRTMAANSGVRTLMASIIPPGATHDEVVYSLGFPEGNLETLVTVAGQLGSLLSDFFVRSVPKSTIRRSAINRLPAVSSKHLEVALRLRVLRLVCQSNAYAELWKEVYTSDYQMDAWSGGLPYKDRPQLGDVSQQWNDSIPLRRAADRRQAELEIDAIVALMYGIDIDSLCFIYRGQFPVLYGYETRDYLFDSGGRQVTRVTDGNGIFTHPFSKNEYKFEEPFVTLDREKDMRKAYSHFERIFSANLSESIAK
ncbi:DNA methyltransferase [Glutamicibacter protophormiae]|uniref:DNA methyltransferase n=1 Tax=Glutamicibacter protophormiae TaxID=37930 RepID=UPI003A8FEEC9